MIMAGYGNFFVIPKPVGQTKPMTPAADSSFPRIPASVQEKMIDLLISPYTLMFSTVRMKMPITKDIAAIPRLMRSISPKRFQKGRSLATDI